MFVVFMEQKVKTTKYGLVEMGLNQDVWTAEYIIKRHKGNRNSIGIEVVCANVNSHNWILSLIFKCAQGMFQRNAMLKYHTKSLNLLKQFFSS